MTYFNGRFQNKVVNKIAFFKKKLHYYVILMGIEFQPHLTKFVFNTSINQLTTTKNNKCVKIRPSEPIFTELGTAQPPLVYYFFHILIFKIYYFLTFSSL